MRCWVPSYLWVNGVGVDEHALDVGEICVVLQGPHVQPGLLAQLADARSVVVRQGAIGEDGVRDLR